MENEPTGGHKRGCFERRGGRFRNAPSRSHYPAGLETARGGLAAPLAARLGFGCGRKWVRFRQLADLGDCHKRQWVSCGNTTCSVCRRRQRRLVQLGSTSLGSVQLGFRSREAARSGDRRRTEGIAVNNRGYNGRTTARGPRALQPASWRVEYFPKKLTTSNRVRLFVTLAASRWRGEFSTDRKFRVPLTRVVVSHIVVLT